MQEIDSRVSEAIAQFRERMRRRIAEARQRLLEEANFGLRVDLGPNDLEGEQGAWRGELEGVIRDAFPRGRDGEIDPCLGPLEGWFSRVRVDIESVEGYLIKINAWAARELRTTMAYRAGRRSEQPEEAATRVEDEARVLARRLIPVNFALVGCSLVADILCRDVQFAAPGAGAQVETRGPSWLVKELESSSAGCKWLLKCFEILARALRLALEWGPGHTCALIQLMGWNALDATKIREVGKIVLACHALDRERLNFFAQVREQLGEEDRATFDAWLKSHTAETRVRGDEEKSRKFLVSLVEREMARLTAKATAHLEEDASESAKLAAMYAFDSTEEGMKVKKSEKKQVRALLAGLQRLCDSMNRTTLGN